MRTTRRYGLPAKVHTLYYGSYGKIAPGDTFYRDRDRIEHF